MSALPKPQEEFKPPRSKPIPVFMRNTEAGLVPAADDIEIHVQVMDKLFGDI